MLGGQGRGQTKKHLGNVSKGMAGRSLKIQTQSQNDEEMTGREGRSHPHPLAPGLPTPHPQSSQLCAEGKP